MALLSNGGTNGSRTLETLAEQVSGLQAVSKQELQPGDYVLVTTKNSLYTVGVLGGELYAVSGGWFDQHNLSPTLTTINGCTWGGSAIKHDIVAAPGLFLEFGNRVTTSQIRQVRILRGNRTQNPN